MSKRTIVTIVIVALMLTVTAGSGATGAARSSGTGTVAGPAVPPSGVGTSIGFFENLGQFPDGDVAFYRRMSDAGIAFGAEGVFLTVLEPVDREVLRSLRDRSWDHRESRDELASLVERGVAGHTVRLAFDGANAVTPVGDRVLEGEHNFLIGNDPGAWRTGVRAYDQVVYEDLWEGIDLVYSIGEGGMKYEFHVSPGVDVSRIRVTVEGAEGLSVEDGELVISTSVEPIIDSGLVSFHEGSLDRPLASSFRLIDSDTYGFEVRGRDPTRPLVIDPWVFSTFLGGAGGDDDISDIETDGDGDVYVVGSTDSGNFPTTAGAFERNLPGWWNSFVTKLGSDGSDLVFSTYLGGSMMDMVMDIDVDASEDIHLCGYTYSDDFPLTAGAYQTTFMDDMIMNFTAEGFVTKLNSAGDKLDHSTYLGSDNEDILLSLTLDGAGRIYVTGITGSFNLTTSAGAYQTSKGDNDTWYYDAVVRVLDSTASRLLYSTYLGSEDDDIGIDVEVNDLNQVYVGGVTYSPGFANTTGAFQNQYKGFWAESGFVTKLRPDLTDLVFSTFLGGSEDDWVNSLVLNEDGNVTVAGGTYSSDFPVSPNAYKTRLGMYSGDAFASTLSADGSTLLSSTFLGGSDDDVAIDIEADGNGDFHLGGETYSMNFPTTTGAVDTTLGGDTDGFYTVLLKNMTDVVASTYIGGSDDDTVHAVLPVGIQGLLAGMTWSTDLHTTTGAYMTRFPGGDISGFLGKLSFDSVPPFADAGPDVTIDQHETVDFDGSNCHDNVAIVNWSWSFEYEGEDVTLHGMEVSFTFDEAGVYVVELRVADAAELTGRDTLTVTVRDITPPTADAGRSRSVEQHATVVFHGLGSADNVGITNWTWSFTYDGEEVLLYGPDPEFTFDEAGEFEVTLTVTDAVGLTASDVVTVYVLDITDPVADPGADIQVDQHETVVLDASASSDNTGIVNWTWSFVYRGSPVSLYGEVVEFVFDDAGTFQVSLNVADGAGNLGMGVVTVLVMDITPPTADAGEDVEVVQGTGVDLDGTGSTDNQGVASYTWTFDYQGVPIEFQGRTPSYYFDAAGVYVVTLTVADNAGNIATDTVTVVVLDTQAPLADAGEDVTVDQGDTVNLLGTGSSDNVGVVSWVWTFTYGGEAKELTGPTPSFVFDDAGVYLVDLVVEDARGNSADDQLTVTVNDITAPVADAGADRTSDQGEAVVLDGSASTDNLGVETYTWTFGYGGGTETLTGRTVQFSFDVPGDYTVDLTVADAAGNTATDSFDLHVRDTVLPVPPSMSDLEAGAGDKVTLDGKGAYDNVGVVKWTWTFREGGRTVTLEGQKVSHTFDEAGTYKVTLTVEDAEGNRAATKFDVTVASSSWLWVVIVVVLVIVAVAAFMMTRRRGGGVEEEGAPGATPEKQEIVIEERFAQ